MENSAPNPSSIFVDSLERRNPAILEHLFRPADRALREAGISSRLLFGAYNSMMEFIDRRVHPFPRVSGETARFVADQIAMIPVDLCKQEIELASASADSDIRAWGEQIVIQEAAFQISVVGEDEIQAEKAARIVSAFFWGVFACLRRSRH